LTVFELLGKISLDSSDYDNGIDSAKQKTSTFAEVLKANLAGEAIIAGVKKVASVVADIGKAAYDSYAEYEQLAGGAELMFGDAYEFVAQKAKNAYKTVQMSQNAYLQQVNGLATGLKTSMDGNAQAAAELADKVITAEADVVAATGNSQEAVQNAFNGIMKSNYTMLDNLQLGITPTKEGFQQLIDTVNEWNEENGKATEYTIDNLADCQAALVDYIEMQGLAGYAANEAADTIEGSTASMKAAWENLATGMADDNANMTELVQNFVDSVFVAGKNIVPRVKQIVSGVGTATTEVISYLRETNSTIDLVVTAMEDVAVAAATAGAVLVANMAGNAVRNIATIFTANATALEYFTAESGKAAVQEATLNGVFSVSEIVVGVLTGKISLATAAQYAWNTAMAANPIGLMAATIAGAAVVTKKLADASKDQIQALAGQAETIEDAKQKYADLKAELEELENAPGGWTYERTAHIHGLKQAIKEVEGQIAEFEQVEEEAAEKAAEPANQFKATTEEYAAAATELLNNVAQTYENIYSKVDSYFQPFEKASATVKTSVSEIMQNMQSQIDFNTQYTANLQYLKEAGLGSLSEALQSYGKDGAAYASTIATALQKAGGATTEEGQKIIAQFQSLITGVDESKAKLTDGLTFMNGQFETQGQQLADDYAAKIKDLDKSGEALAAAQNTMNGLLSGITSGTSGIMTAMSNLGQKMTSKLQASLGTVYIDVVARATGEIPGHKNGLDYVPYDNYLSYLHKGEAVLTAAEARLWRAGKSAGESFGRSAATDDNTSSGKSRGMTIIQNIQAVVQSEVELAAATEAYFTQARWAM
jgi:phage-related protein